MVTPISEGLEICQISSRCLFSGLQQGIQVKVSMQGSKHICIYLKVEPQRENKGERGIGGKEGERDGENKRGILCPLVHSPNRCDCWDKAG